MEYSTNTMSDVLPERIRASLSNEYYVCVATDQTSNYIIVKGNECIYENPSAESVAARIDMMVASGGFKK